jgi:hypothetical protein
MSKTFKIESGDVSLSSATGRPITIQNESKLKQDIQEFFSIEVLPNGFGSGLEQLIGIVEINQAAFAGIAARQISDGMTEYINLQKSEPRIQRSIEERVIGFNNFSVEVSPNDPTKFIFRINIKSAAGRSTPVAILKSLVP